MKVPSAATCNDYGIVKNMKGQRLIAVAKSLSIGICRLHRRSFTQGTEAISYEGAPNIAEGIRPNNCTSITHAMVFDYCITLSGNINPVQPLCSWQREVIRLSVYPEGEISWQNINLNFKV
jgi:hypothetical protein